MSKIIFSVLILAIVSGCMCNDFLVFDSPQPQARMMPVYDIEQITPAEFLKFASGVHQGFGFFNNLPFQNECAIVDQQIIEKAKEIFNLVKTLNIKNAMNVLRDVTNKGNEIIQLIAKQSQGCQNWAKELTTVFNRLVGTVRQRSYPNDLLYHSLTNMGTITDRVVKSVDLFVKNDFINSGIIGGGLMRFLFFWSL
jgi:hypothetical protein